MTHTTQLNRRPTTFGFLIMGIALATIVILLFPGNGTAQSTPTGPAGGDLTGTYPNPGLAVDRVRKTGDTINGSLTISIANPGAIMTPFSLASPGNPLNGRGVGMSFLVPAGGSTTLLGGNINSVWGLNAQTYMSFGAYNNGVFGEVFRMDGRGMLGIGTTTPSTAYKLDVNGEINATGFRINGTPIATGGASQWTTFPSTSNIYYNTGNVGIGTTSPVYSLDVNGGTNGFRAKAASAFSNDTIATFENSTGIQAIFRANGNVGFGTTAPAYKLDVQGNAQWIARFKKTDATNGGIIVDAAAGWNPNLAMAVDGTVKWYMNSNTSNGDTLQFWESTGGQPRFTLTQAGNVGIGTATPVSTLDVRAASGSINSTSTTGTNRAYFGATNTGGSALMGLESSTGLSLFNLGTLPYAAVFGTTQARAVQLVTNQTARMTIDASGNVGIGTTNPANGKLQVNKIIRIDDDSGSTSGSDTLSAAPMLYLGTTAGGNAFQFNAAGGLDLWQFNTTAWGRTVTFAKTGNVGIGTTNPAAAYKLDVNGEINATGLRINGTPIATGGQWTPSGASDIYFNTGKVGIGAASPASPLFITGDEPSSDYATLRIKPTVTHGGIVIDSANNTSQAHLRFFKNGVPKWQFRVPFQDGVEDFRLFSWAANSDVLNVTPAGNVGIGTGATAPSAKLHVAGDVKVAGSGDVTITATGDLTATGTITGGTINAKYQDVAEWVQSSQALAAGTVVVLDHTRSNQVIASSKAYDTRVAGVISIQPGIALGESGAGKVLVATTGRVKIKVDASAGPIQIGDLLVTSDKEGVARKSEPLNLGGIQIHRPGTLIGKALEPLAKGTGEILVLLSLQ